MFQPFAEQMHNAMPSSHAACLAIRIDRSAGRSLAEQISAAIGDAIRDGRLAPGARLPSWHDLSVQLGVARGTVRVAYERLRDQQLVAAAGAAGTRVASQQAGAGTRGHGAPGRLAIPARPSTRPAVFQVGVPAQDVFPFKTWSRIMGRAARTAAAVPLAYPDPRGEPALRAEIAAYLSFARGIACDPGQVLVTTGYAGALAMALRALRLDGRRAWIEDPGYAPTRELLAQSGLRPVPVPVDDEGLDVAAGIRHAPDAALAVVTPGQQAPLGMTLPLARRRALLEWAASAQAWIVEDDYLGELQLQGRATPALASLDHAGRVLHIGTFSKTISPALRVGFMVAPPGLAEQMGKSADTWATAPAPAVQLAVAGFMREGHYLRHLRRVKRLYAERRRALAACLRGLDIVHQEAGLSVLVRLGDGVDDLQLAEQARTAGLGPSALSWWCAGPGQRGLLLGVSNVQPDVLHDSCARLAHVLGAGR
ncbi:MocR-like pyridoxine biosynthesis transcription factor PdxR [Massilia agri]|uniref:PLP-dependent aminotransferase family protein n=1 Tax=Massilia agri TaxID=1886785 RepID=A0ABT2AGH9_9BURK|nr:PLP-dependent aminotransferase family protein [Massilia agri]MCS0595342.1 PLP-dependent aminotransferase family protein [Massilia agri]